MPDLWPNDFGHQAKAFAAKTKGLVIAESESSASRTGIIQHRSYVEAPMLDGYRYELFTVKQGVLLYPVDVHFGDEFYGDIPSPEKFQDRLKRILTSQKTIDVIRALMSQASSLSVPA